MRHAVQHRARQPRATGCSLTGQGVIWKPVTGRLLLRAMAVRETNSRLPVTF